jgi:hypothetical protein
MKFFLTLLAFILFLVSCNYNKECKSEFLLGRYKLDTSLLTSYNNNDTTILTLARKSNWDKIILIVGKNKYHFEECEEYFRKYEGTWEYKSIGFDGDCYVYINQKEGARKIPLDPFNIAVKVNNKTIVLPFKKT